MLSGDSLPLISWIVADRVLIAKLTTAKQGTDLHTSTLLQRANHYYLTHFNTLEHVQKICQTYKARRDLMLTELQENYSIQVKWTEPSGGMFIWLTLPKSYDTLKLLPRVEAANVAYVPALTSLRTEESTAT